MILPVSPQDLPAIESLIERVILSCIVAPRRDLAVLVKDSIGHERWALTHPEDCAHYLYKEDGEVVGVILVKHYWNLANLFVLPEYQGGGIGSRLLDRALAECAAHAPGEMVRLNSSHYGEQFYRRYGFRQAGAPRPLPGGCIPFEYLLQG